jgi:hydrophobic/amphiphilic exporter-1 (mainly G- bacteria), HAE1 family
MKIRISAWAIRNPTPVAILFVALSIWGLLAYNALPIKHYPNVNFPVVVVSVTQSGAAAPEMENQITRPIENALASVQHVKHINSSVSLGSTSIGLEFDLGTDMQKATDDVRTAVDRVRPSLPSTIDPPQVSRVDVDGAPILTYTVSSNTLSPTELSWFVDDTIGTQLQAIKGVAQVSRVGGANREIQVLLDPDRMVSFGVTAPQVSSALARFHVDNTGGRANIGGQEQSVRVLGSATTIDELRSMTIPVNGRHVRLSDVAEVGDGPAEERRFARLNGRPVVAFQVSKTKESSDVFVERLVTEKVKEIAAKNPKLTITPIVSTVDETRHSYEATVHVLLEGMALAALVVWLFLRNWRATMVAAIAMPLSLAPTFGVMMLLGFSLNVITLLGLTLVIGILVDDAIVEIENIEKRIEQGATPYRAALIGADAIGLAVVACTMSIVVVFTPVSFMPGISGQFFKEFGLTVAVAVMFSLLVARFLTPLLAAYFLKPSAHPQPKPEMPGFYRRMLRWALSHMWASAGIAAALVISTLGLVVSGALPVGFQPVGDPGYFYLNIQGPPGATHADMERIVQNATAVLQRQSDVGIVFAQVGSGGGGDGFDGGGPAEGNTGTITVVLKDDRKHTTEQFKSLIRPEIRRVPDVRLTTLGGWGSADIDIVLSSEDGQKLDQAQLELQREMRTLSSVSDVRPSPPPPGPELVIRPKPDEAARLGVTAEVLGAVTRVATIGDIDPAVAKYSEGKRRLPIRVRLPESERRDLSKLAQLRVPTADGGATTLESVADLTFESGPAKISRYGRERRASVQADLNNSLLGTTTAEVYRLPIMKKILAGKVPGVKPTQFGQAEALAELIPAFLGAIVAGIALIYAVLVLLFGSFFKPVTIMAALPLSMIGAILALIVTHQAITMPVFIGILMLFGITAKNSILLVEFAIEDERSGTPRVEALMNACRERARPIIMTTVAMAAGMLPTAMGLGQGSEFRQPMAIAVIGGLISSTALSLVLVPVVYEFIDMFENFITPFFRPLITPRTADDDRPILDEEDAIGPAH